jgi:GTPase SAR1 family protein
MTSGLLQGAAAREIVGEHIHWAERAARSVLPSEDREVIDRLCAVLAERSADRPLQVGVFGQFSSGKSTLLNALLGAGLLPSAARVTTAVETRLRPAGTDMLSVTLRDSGTTLDAGTTAFKSWYQSTVGGAEPADIRAVLRQIMRSQTAAQSLDRIDIGPSGTVLGPGVVMIDTPGFDAIDVGHREITERAAAGADLAIVLIPANSPGAVSLSRFLHEVLTDLGDRCVFVLTKFRQVPLDERDDLQQHVESWLEQQGFPQPTVIRADATDIAVAVADGGTASVNGEIDADAALAETRDIAGQLRALAADRRQQLIEATLRVLLSRLLASVTQAVGRRQATLEEMRQRLRGVQIVDLGEFLDQWQRELSDDLERSARYSVARARSVAGPEDELSRARDRAVNRVGSSNGITSIVAGLLDETRDILTDWTADALREAVDSSGEDLADQAERLKKTFSAQYADLAALSGADPQPPQFERSLPSIALPDIDLTNAFDPLRAVGQELQSSANWKSGGGAAAGAAIGTMFFPGVGTVLGGLIGLAAGSAPRSKEKQRLRADAEAMHAASLEAARDAIWDTESSLRAALYAAVHALAARYTNSAGPIIDRLTADYNAEVAQLDAELRLVLDILSEARRRLDALAQRGLESEA